MENNRDTNDIQYTYVFNHIRIHQIFPTRKEKNVAYYKRLKKKYELAFFLQSLITSLPTLPYILQNRLSGTQTNFSPAHSGTASDRQLKMSHFYLINLYSAPCFLSPRVSVLVDYKDHAQLYLDIKYVHCF